MSAKKELSLLSDVDNIQSFSNRLLHWISTVGRILLITTNLIVVSVFISRFWLDRKNADLSETLRQQKAIIESTKEFEADFNSLQARLNYIKSYILSSNSLSPKLVSLTQSIPTQVLIDNLTVNDGDTATTVVQLTATALNEQSIVDLVSNLILNPQIKSVEISSIEKKSKTNKFKIILSLNISSQSNPNERI